MSSKTKVSAKKSSNAKTPKKKENNSQKLSSGDTKLLNESLKIVEMINGEISKVKDAKNKLELDVSKLKTKVSKTSRPVNTNQNLSKLKDEVMEEFSPILKTLNPSKLKENIIDEINQLTQIEHQKLKSELKSKSAKNNNSLSKKISELEDKLVGALKENNSQNKEVETEVQKVLEKAKIKLDLNLKNTNTNLKKLSEEFSQYKNSSNEFNKNYNKLKSQVEILSKEKHLDVSSIESKLINLQDENRVIKKLLEKYENELYSREEDESSVIEKKVDELLRETSKNLVKAKKDEESQAQFIVDKVNEIIDNVNTFENHIQKTQLKTVKDVETRVSGILKSAESSLSKNLKTQFNEALEESSQKLNSNISEFQTKDKEYEKHIANFKVEIANHVKEYITELDSELKLLKEKNKELTVQKNNFLNEIHAKVGTDISTIETKINELIAGTDLKLRELLDEKEKERQFLVDRFNEFVNVFNSFYEKSQIDLNQKKLELESESKELAKSILEKSKEEIAKQILSQNDAIVRINTQNKEEMNKLSEDIEDKFVTSKSQYDEIFNSHLKKFEEELKEKESEFISKLALIQEEKTHMLKEIDEFKFETNKLTDDYFTKLNTELEKIKAEEMNFSTMKTQFIADLDALTHAKKTEIEDFSIEQENKVANVILEEKEGFERHENTFREIFQEKIKGLHDYVEKRLDKIQKNFVDKNLKIVDKRIEEELNVLKILEEGINAKANEIDIKSKMIEEKETEIYNELQSYEENMGGKVEERLVGLEQQLNKRFLELDSSFTNFKGVVVDEVEDLMKEIKTVVDDRVDIVDKSIAKINFAGSEVVKRIQDFDGINKQMEVEIEDIRGDVNDLRIKFEITGPHFDSMTNMIQMMSEYEHGLLNLIKSLRARGVTEQEIKKALIHKGHPSFYVNMVLENFDLIQN